jgi:hypothetical protein
MLTDTSMRPAGTLATTAVPIHDRPTAGQAVRTELPSRHTVTATAATAPKDAPTATARPVTHQVVVDTAAAAIVYQDVDQRTNQVVKQYPEEAALRRRTYLRQLEAKQAQEVLDRVERDRPGFASSV